MATSVTNKSKDYPNAAQAENKDARLIYLLINKLLTWRKTIALSSIVGIWMILLWPAFDQARSFALFMDNEFFIGTMLSGMSNSFRDGEWPLRLTTVLGGLPIYNFAQLSPFYPFYLAPLALYENPLDATTTMHWITLFHILLNAVNMYILIRVVGATKIASVAGASLLAFGSNSLSYAVWLNITAPYAWLPLYLAGLIGVLKFRSSAIYPAMAIFAIVMLVFASPSQPLIHAVLLSSVLVLFFFWHNRTQLVSRDNIAVLTKLVAIGVISFLISAPVILPVTVGFSDMIRWIGSAPPVYGYQKIPFSGFLTDQLSIKELAGVLVNYTEKDVGGVFIGPVACSLVVIALISRSRTWITLSMAVIAVYSLASSTGSNLGLAYINYNLPLVNKIREPSRFLYLFHLASGILIAIGIDEIRKLAGGCNRSLNWRQLSLTCITILLISLAIVYRTNIDADKIIIMLMPYGILATVMISSILIGRTSWPLRNVSIGIAWSISVVAVIYSTVNWKPNLKSDSHYLNKDCAALDTAINRIAKLDPDHNYRVVFEGKIDKQMASMLASYQNVRTLNCYVNPAPSLQFHELYNHLPRVDNYLQVLGVRYLICPNTDGAKYLGFDFLETINGYDIHQSSKVLPYAYFVRRLDGYFNNLSDFIAKANSCDLSDGLLYIETDQKMPPPENISSPSNTFVKNIKRKKNHVHFIVSGNSPGVLILNEFFSTSWKIKINGVSKSAMRVNGNQIGVQLPAGSHVVEFSFQPWIFYISVTLAAVGMLLFFVFIFISCGHKESNRLVSN